MRTLRSITGYTLYDHKRSEEMMKTCEIQDGQELGEDSGEIM